jgi:putative membrane protein insertion efficiency factor
MVVRAQTAVREFAKQTISFSIRLYQILLSPLTGPCCRFYPSCSEYMLQALEVHGLLLGLYLGLKRLCFCHPLGRSGYDPVPLKKHTTFN